MIISSYLDEYLMPPEVFQRFMIPLSYGEILTHCRAYHIKTDIIVCSKDLWVKKIERVPIKKRQKLFNNSMDKGHILLVQTLLDDENVDPADYDNEAIRSAAENGYAAIVELLLADSRVNPADNDNEAIRLSAEYGYIDVVKLLLADPRMKALALGEASGRL